MKVAVDVKITIIKTIDFDELTIGNIIVDGFLCSGYNFGNAQLACERIMQGGKVHNACTGAVITKTKVIHSIQRYLSAEHQNDIEMACDNASDIIRSIV